MNTTHKYWRVVCLVVVMLLVVAVPASADIDPTTWNGKKGTASTANNADETTIQTYLNATWNRTWGAPHSTYVQGGVNFDDIGSIAPPCYQNPNVYETYDKNAGSWRNLDASHLQHVDLDYSNQSTYATLNIVPTGNVTTIGDIAVFRDWNPSMADMPSNLQIHGAQVRMNRVGSCTGDATLEEHSVYLRYEIDAITYNSELKKDTGAWTYRYLMYPPRPNPMDHNFLVYNAAPFDDWNLTLTKELLTNPTLRIVWKVLMIDPTPQASPDMCSVFLDYFGWRFYYIDPNIPVYSWYLYDGGRLLMFNEPDGNVFQDDLTPIQAAVLYKDIWNKYMLWAGEPYGWPQAVILNTTYKTGHRPNNGWPYGEEWREDFWAAIEWYWSAWDALETSDPYRWSAQLTLGCHDYQHNIANAQANLAGCSAESTAQGFGGDIWLTEFAMDVGGTDAQKQAGLKTFVNWMDCQDWIERYAYFSSKEHVPWGWPYPSQHLFDSSMNPTIWGIAYADHALGVCQ